MASVAKTSGAKAIIAVQSPVDPHAAVLQAVLKTAFFAATKHSNQKRKNKAGSPYINHPIEVALLIATVAGVTNIEILQAALLHDTVEDTDTTFDEIEKHFGKVVRDIVVEVTDPKGLTKLGRKKYQLEFNFSPAAQLIKMADKLNNLSDMLVEAPPAWDLLGIQGYTVWGKKVVDRFKGANKGLDKALAEMFSKSFTYKGTAYPMNPAGADELLAKYFATLDKK